MTTMIPTMNDRVAIERRHAEFDRMQRYEYMDSAALDELVARGWRFMVDHAAADWRGWWVNDSMPEHARPHGDSRQMRYAAYKTAQLYTDINVDDLKARADAIRREEWVRSFVA